MIRDRSPSCGLFRLLLLLAWVGCTDNNPVALETGESTIHGSPLTALAPDEEGRSAWIESTASPTPEGSVESVRAASMEESLSITRHTERVPGAIGPTYEIQPTGQGLASAIRVGIRAAPEDRPLVAAGRLEPSLWTDEEWQALDQTQWDPTTLVASGTTTATGIVGLLPRLDVKAIREQQGRDFDLGSIKVNSSLPVAAAISVTADGITILLKAMDYTTSAAKAAITVTGLSAVVAH